MHRWTEPRSGAGGAARRAEEEAWRAELLALDEETLSDFAEHHPEILKRFEEVAQPHGSCELDHRAWGRFTDIAKNAGLNKIKRIERGICYFVGGGDLVYF